MKREEYDKAFALGKYGVGRRGDNAKNKYLKKIHFLELLVLFSQFKELNRAKLSSEPTILTFKLFPMLFSSCLE